MATVHPGPYKKQHDFESRKAEALKMRKKYPSRIPVIVERYVGANDSEIPAIDKNKFLIPDEMTVGQFMFIIRKRLTLNEAQTLFLFVESTSDDGQTVQTLAKSSDAVSKLYEQHKDQDHFLYMVYTSQNAFGQ